MDRTHYTQLTLEERYHIQVMRKQGKSLRSIAIGMGRSHSTLSRELRRNQGGRGYRHKQADRLAFQRHRNKAKAKKLTQETQDYIQEKIRLRWSPEQVCGRLLNERNLSLSPETLYRYLLKDQQRGGDLSSFLRHRNKPYRKRYAKRDKRGKIPNRIDISERPEVVGSRTRLGDWEADLVLGKQHQGAIVTLAERRSRIYLALPIARKTVTLTNQAILALLKPLKPFVHTITFDNGLEFAKHETVARDLDCKTFFAKPYHSWERGLNENFNGLLRQYFPKSLSFKGLETKRVLEAVEQINQRPRKCLNFYSPYEVFERLSNINPCIFNTGALMS